MHHSVNEHFNDEAFQDGSTEALMDDDIFDVMDTNESTDKVRKGIVLPTRYLKIRQLINPHSPLLQTLLVT